MVKSWEDIKTAIQNLKKVRRAVKKDIYNLPVGSLLRIDGNYYIIGQKEKHSDWTEYKLKNILNNKKSYLEVEEDRFNIWERAPRNEEINVLEKFSKGKCTVLERGSTEEYRYFVVKCDEKIYSIEEYRSEEEIEREVYKSRDVGNVELL